MKPNTLLNCLLLLFCSLSGFSQIHVNENFNGGVLPANWSNSAISGTHNWAFGIDGSSDHTGNQNLDGTNFAYFDDSFYGASSTNDHTYLETPSFDNSTLLVTFLEFDYNFRNFGAAVLDSFDVQVYDGTNWISVFSRTSNDCGSYIAPSCANGFPHAKIDISSYANTNCRVRFIYYDGNDWSWYLGLDNVYIYSPADKDIGISQILTPVGSCGLGTNEPITVVISNYGGLPQSNFTVSYRINGGIQTSEIVNKTVPINDTILYTFNSRGNFSTPGTYSIEAYTDLNQDAIKNNDTSQVSIQSTLSYSPTYFESFENGLGDWTIYGANSSWANGIPNSFSLKSAADGNHVMATNLTGPYNNSELSYLESPCFDFNVGIGDPIMTFSMFYAMELVFDKCWMEYSTDNGLTWSKLNGAINAKQWYNNIQTNTWSGNSNGWLNVQNTLSGLGNQSQVKLRFAFSSDGSTTLEGVAIDKFTLRFPQAIDMAVNQIVYPTMDTNGCSLHQSSIIIEVENAGINTINSYLISYQVNNGAVFTDSINTSINSGSTRLHTFSAPYSFGSLSSFYLQTWVSAIGDTYAINDTAALDSVINNGGSARTLPYIQNFDKFTDGTVFSNTNDSINDGWDRVTSSPSTSFSQYFWRVGVGTNNRSGNTGPGEDYNTGGNGGYFMYTEASGGASGDTTFLISPCIALSNDTTFTMSFWWHRYGTQILSPIYVDVFDGNNWVNVRSVSAQPQMNNFDPWQNELVNLSAFAGRIVKVRFWAVSGGCCTGDMAIDDVRIFDSRGLPEIVDAGFPVNSTFLCSDSVITNLDVQLVNIGDSLIPSDSLIVYYQLGSQNVLSDTVRSSIVPHQPFTVSLAIPPYNQLENLKVWLNLKDDLNQNNDTSTVVIHPNYIKPGYFNSFDNWNTQFNYCWGLNTGWYGSWYVGDSTLNGTQRVLPTKDHTISSSKGKFIYSFMNPTNSTNMGLFFPLIDLNNQTSAFLNFYYHFNNFNGDAILRIYPDHLSQVFVEDTIKGPFQLTQNDPWLPYSLDLSSYVGDTVRIQLYGNVLLGSGNPAIDDVSISTLPVGINDLRQIEEGISIYPNPSNGQFNLVLSDRDLIGKRLQLYNTNGQLVKEEKISERQLQMDLEGYPKGMYYLTVTSSNSRITKKLVIH